MNLAVAVGSAVATITCFQIRKENLLVYQSSYKISGWMSIFFKASFLLWTPKEIT